MAAVGFEPRDRGTVFVLREVRAQAMRGGERGGNNEKGGAEKGRGEVSEARRDTHSGRCDEEAWCDICSIFWSK